MYRPRLHRRTLLRGAGGVAAALPALDVMLNSHGTALAAGEVLPQRYLVCFGGFSLGADGVAAQPVPYAPKAMGPGYDLPAGLAPLSGSGNIKNQISVVSGLRIPQPTNVDQIPPGGRFAFHGHPCPMFAGTRAPPWNINITPVPSLQQIMSAASSDQIVAAAASGATQLDSIVYRVQASSYVVTDDGARQLKGIMSYKKDAQGAVVPITPEVSPRAAFSSLFTSFRPTDPTQALALRKRKSILDFVDRKMAGLLPRLGAADRHRLGAHFDEIRDLEKRLAALDSASPMAASCTKLGDPGPDPPVGSSSAKPEEYPSNGGYSNEDARARLFDDLVQMAFACDLVRAGSLMYTHFQSFMNLAVPLGLSAQLHTLQHNGTADDCTKIAAWHMKHFGYLVSKLRDTPEGAGSLLDRCAIVYQNEGGYGAGYDEDVGKIRPFSSHSTEAMVCLVAGGAGGLKRGVHVVAPSAANHPANVLITAMNAVGVPGGLGEISGSIPDLLG